MTRVAPASPPAPYIGGKSRLAPLIIDRISGVPHRLYVEPFVGLGGVFLRRRRTVQKEVINDLNRDIATLFRVLRHHYRAFMDECRYQLTSRAEFVRLRRSDPETLTDIQRAVRFLYLQRLAFGGRPTRPVFGVSPEAPKLFDGGDLEAALDAVHRRLSGVVIECLPWSDCLERYDNPDALFYLDPPYWGTERDYGAAFDRMEFGRMAEKLAALRGSFILSLNDRPEVRSTFGHFRIEQVRTTYSIGRDANTAAAELLISGGRAADNEGVGRLL
ncbi:DNA adenine methylase [Tistrella mobilis]|uniref:DNA adenine methylase n=1 Tax=Tistrella mobilis TaxID=171437 RepID=UPI0035582B9F